MQGWAGLRFTSCKFTKLCIQLLNGIDALRFEWDPQKAAANILKHGVSFTLAIEVWDDPLHVIVPDRIVAGEERWHAIGSVAGISLLIVVHSYRDETDAEVVRIIGARPATKHERRQYEEGP